MNGRGPRPTLVGVLRLPRDVSNTQRRDARFAIAQHANEQGYAHVETFEVCGSAVWDAKVYAVIEAWADRADAHAFLVAGDVDEERLERIAERTRVIVRRI